VRHIPHACFWASCNIHCGLNILLVLRHFLLKFKTKSCSVLVGNPEGKRNLARPSHGWVIILKWILKKQGGWLVTVYLA
jgi:hypothetical protein